MEIDGGGSAGLENSRHRENRAPAKPGGASKKKKTTGAAGVKINGFGQKNNLQHLNQLAKHLCGGGTFDELDADGQKHVYTTIELVRRMLETTQQHPTTPPATPSPPSTDNGAITKNELRLVVEEAVAKSFAAAPGTITGRGSYAAAVTRGLAGPVAPQAPKVVPERVGRQLLVRAKDAPAELANRTHQEIVSAVNVMSPGRARNPPVAAVTKMQDGSMMFTFSSSEDRDIHATSTDWLRAVAPTAQVDLPSHQVLVRNVPVRIFAAKSEEELRVSFAEENKMEVKQVRLQKQHTANPEATGVIVSVLKLSDAVRLCNIGAFWKSQVFRCEPFDPSIRPTQCYKCQQWGHKAYFCKQEAKCARCAGPAHEGGDRNCPLHDEPTKWKCTVCGGNHAAFHRRTCPTALRLIERSRIAYQQRSLTFEDNSPPTKRFGDFSRVAFTTKTPQVQPPSLTATSRKRRAVSPYTAERVQMSQPKILAFTTTQLSTTTSSSSSPSIITNPSSTPLIAAEINTTNDIPTQQC